jgi:hypothetical protein
MHRKARVPERSGAGPSFSNVEDVNDDPFLAALAAAELDDEPYTDEQRAAALAGWEACQRGETVPWEEVRSSLLRENEAAKTPTS